MSVNGNVDNITTTENVIDGLRSDQRQQASSTTKYSLINIITSPPKESMSFSGETFSGVVDNNLSYQFTNSAGGGATHPAKFGFSTFINGP